MKLFSPNSQGVLPLTRVRRGASLEFLPFAVRKLRRDRWFPSGDFEKFSKDFSVRYVRVEFSNWNNSARRTATNSKFLPFLDLVRGNDTGEFRRRITCGSKVIAV